MMFDDVLRSVEEQLDIPYPHRTLVIRELEADMFAQYSALIEDGVGEDEARARTLRDMALDRDTLDSLETIHNPAIRRILLRLPSPVREPIEWLCAGLPILALVYIFVVEVPMLDFLRQGGGAMWAILLVAGAAYLLQFRRAFSWFIQRDHSRIALARNTATPLYLAGAVLCMGIASTALNFYVVMDRWVEGKFPDFEWVWGGFIESLSSVIVAGNLAALILIFQAMIQAGLRAMQVRQPAQPSTPA